MDTPTPPQRFQVIPLAVLQGRDTGNDLKGAYLAGAMAIAIGGNADAKGNVTMPVEPYRELNKRFRPQQLPPAKRKPVTTASPPNFKVATWDELHTHVWTNDPVTDAIYILDFNFRIRVEGCKTTRACKFNFSIHALTNPPPLGNGHEAMFEWGVTQHNLVSAEVAPLEFAATGKTSKRRWTVAEARARWLPNPPNC